MNYPQAVSSYIKYLLTAQTKYYIHSPFIYELSEEVIYDKKKYYAFDTIEHLRRQWQLTKDWVEITDFGAGSKVMGQAKQRKVADIASYAVVPAKVGRLLFRLIHFLKPKYIVELGTSLGISTAYMATAQHIKSEVHTIEGSTAIAKLASRTFEVLGLTNIQQHVGTFDEQLPKVLRKLPTVDMVFLDGNHQPEATLKYFEQSLKIAQNGTLFVLDDIHWSEGMEKAWQIIQQHQAVTATIDLYRCGLVFLRKEQTKENFKLYF